MGAECLWWPPWWCGLSCGLCTCAAKDRYLQIMDALIVHDCVRAATRAHAYAHRLKFLRSAVRSDGDSADGKTMTIFIIQNSHSVPGLLSRSSSYQPAGGSGGPSVRPSWPFWTLQGARRVQRIQSNRCCNPPNWCLFSPHRSMFQTWRILEGLFVLQDWNVDCGENKHPTGVLRW